MPKGIPNKKYSGEFKKQVVEAVIKNSYPILKQRRNSVLRVKHKSIDGNEST